MSERNLLKRLKLGDTKAFEVLFSKYHKKLYNYVLSFVRDSFEAENVLQDVFISIWETRHKINEDLPIRSQLYWYARNKSLNTLRKSVNKQHYIDYISRIHTDTDSTTEQKIDYEELNFFMRKFINELPERRREIFLCSLDEGLSYKEIALKLDISENTVDTQIRNALDFLRDRIVKYFNLESAPKSNKYDGS